jgi:hypothetical protein
MSTTIQYRYLHKGDNEWLSEPPTDDSLEEWNEAWEEIKKDNTPDIKIEFTEDMYMSSEYGDTPEWVNVTIEDSGVLPFKMARGIVKARTLEGLRSMVFTHHFFIDVSNEWGGWSMSKLEIYEGSTYITFFAKHSNDEVELNITEQFNQAIGETA